MTMNKLTEYIKTLQETPTAPFREQWMCETLDSILSNIPGVELEIDPVGNRIVRLSPSGSSASNAPVVFVAHLDHPGFVVQEVDEECNTVHAVFEGRVKREFFEGSAVRLFRSKDDKGIRSTIKSYTPASDGKDSKVVLVADESPAGAVLGMWDVNPFDISDDRLYGRACDDLCAVGSMIFALSRLAKQKDSLACPVTFLFTLAEEAGFCGALALADHDLCFEYIPEGADIISVEISSVRAGVEQGGGAVLRVGDRATIFSQRLIYRIQTAFNGKSGGNVTYRRALMDGGTCEASAFAAYGFEVAGICAPVMNYHNMDFKEGRVGQEFVSLFDLEMLAEMIYHIPQKLKPSSSYFDDMKRFMRPLLEHGLANLKPENTTTQTDHKVDNFSSVGEKR